MNARQLALACLVSPLFALACSGAGSGAGRGAGEPARKASAAEARAVATTPGSPEVCSNAIDDNENGLIDEGCAGPTGLIHFAIGWRAARADVELRVLDPNGELSEVGRISQSGLTKDRDCPGQRGECQGRNVENVYLAEGQPLPGEYRVRVRLESLAGEHPPLSVELGVKLARESVAYELELEAENTERELRFRL